MAPVSWLGGTRVRGMVIAMLLFAGAVASVWAIQGLTSQGIGSLLAQGKPDSVVAPQQPTVAPPAPSSSQPAGQRSASPRLIGLLGIGFERQIVLSHDSVWCMLGNMIPTAMAAELAAVHEPMRFTNVITPKLLEAGVSQEEIDRMVIDNPRRYFAGSELPKIL